MADNAVLEQDMSGKKIVSAVLFLLLTAVTFYVILKNQDMEELLAAVKNMQKGYLLLAALTAVFFVSAEGILMWYLLKAIGEGAHVLQCVKYAFIGFFYSGITPSASGGQPMQLYHMNRDGYKIGSSTVALMSVAAAYKLVLVGIGCGICIFWWSGLKQNIGKYLPIYFLGLFLNAALVLGILAVMFQGARVERLLMRVEKRLVRSHLLKESATRTEGIHNVIEQYRQAVDFLKGHVSAICFLLAGTLLQRCAVFILTYFVYRGLGLEETAPVEIMALQAVVYIAVDMLPLPGSQGITEVMYMAVFGKVFTGHTLTVSMCISRGLNFYLPFIISAVVAGISWWKKDKKGFCTK